MLIQKYQEGKWGPELPAFRDSLVATGSYFRDFLRKDKKGDSEEFTIKRESSTVFKVEQFNVETAFQIDSYDHSPTNDTAAASLGWESADECKICMTNEADSVLMPCGHSGLCGLCVWKISSQKSAALCPFCRQTIEKVAEIGARASCRVLRDGDMKPISELAGKPRLAWT